MKLDNIGTLFITLVVLLNSIELSSQSNDVVPPPYPHRRPPSYVIENNRVRLTGDSVGGDAAVVDDYFLGAMKNNQWHPVDPRNPLSIVRISTRRFVEVNIQKRIDLMNQYINSRRNRVHAGAISSNPVG